MKKLIFLIVASLGMLAFTTSAHAQFGTAAQLPLKAGDTTVNAGTANRIITTTGGYSGTVIQVKVTKISGTLGGTVKVQGSLDATNYEDIGSAYTVTDVANQTKTFYITAPLPPYIRVLQTGAATMSSVWTIYYVLRRYQSQ